MKLQNVLAHMANQSVLVNGHHYELNGEGITKEDVIPADAAKLLQNRAAWRPVVERQAVSEAAPLPENRPITIPDGRTEAAAPVPPPEPVKAEPLPVPEIKPPVVKGRRR